MNTSYKYIEWISHLINVYHQTSHIIPLSIDVNNIEKPVD